MVILWVTGVKAGCYALLEVASDVYTGPDEPGEQQYQLTGLAGESTQRVKIVIRLNLWNRPVRKEEVLNLPAFSGFKGGNQGTNFTATKEQFEIIERLAQSGELQKGRRYWKYSPGSQASHWTEDFRDKIMTIDFSAYDTGPLDQYTDQAALDTHLGKVGNASNETWNMILFKDTAFKDVVFANRGRNTVVGIGIVNGPYQYRDDSPYNRHYRSVNWLTDKPWQYTPNLFSSKQNLFRVDTFAPTLAGPQIIRAYLNQYPEYRSVFEKNGLLEPAQPEALSMPQPDNRYAKNIILYGPPGTGKTYGTVDLAVDIVDGRTSAEHPVNKARFNQLRQAGQIEFVTFHQNYTYEDFVMGLKPDVTAGNLRFVQHQGIFYEIAKRARTDFEAGQPKNYALIIDEINRANMSRVFGELITLLEEDKRLGEDNELTVMLPSGEAFVVPPNLYVIGTMNTADKSLALLDIALRRRFEFIYKKPDATLLKPAVEPILNDLNRAIRGQHKSADFLIGHAYFIGKELDQLAMVFNNRVIPLLMEYFNGNAKTVIGILEKAGVTAVQDDITDQITVSHVG